MIAVTGPTNGVTTLWYIDQDALEAGAAARVGSPRTSGSSSPCRTVPRRGGTRDAPPAAPDGSRRSASSSVHAVRVPDGGDDPATRGTPGLTFGVLGGVVRPRPRHRAGAGRGAAGRGGGGLGPVRAGARAVRPGLHRRPARHASPGCADAGLGIVLTPGFQYAPAWVRDLPDGAYLDQYGKASPAQRPELRVQRDGSRTRHSATSTGSPPSSRSTGSRPYASVPARPVSSATRAGRLGTKGNGFWAFDDAAQTGNGLADGASSRTRMPGWVPGAADVARAGPSTPRAVRSWFDWYADSAARTVALADRPAARAADSTVPSTCRVPGEGSCPPTSPQRPQRRSTARPTRRELWSGACTTPTSCGPSPATGTGDVSPTSPGSATRRPWPPASWTRRRTAARRRTPRCRCGSAPTRRHLVGDALDRRQRPRNGLRGRGEPRPTGTPGNRRRRASDGLAAQLLQRAPDYARECGLRFYLGLRGRPVQPGLRGVPRRSRPTHRD